jgi:hypothetical protein
MTENIQELFLLGRIIWILVLTLLTFAYVTVGLRLWVRFRITKGPGWDDAAMVATLVSRTFNLSIYRTEKTNFARYSSRVTAHSSL